MNYSAYLATGQMIALMESFSRIKVLTHGQSRFLPARSSLSSIISPASKPSCFPITSMLTLMCRSGRWLINPF